MCSKSVYPESKRVGLGLLIRYDWRFGLLSHLYKYIPAVLIFLLSCASLQAGVGYDTAAGILPPVRLSLGDYLLHTFRGIPVYHLVRQNADNAFILPALWLILNLYPTFLVGGYPLNDLHGYGQQILTRSGTRTRWWLSKICWNVSSVFVFYLVGYAVLLLYACVTGSPAFEATASVADHYFLSGTGTVPTAQWLPYALVLPFLTTAAVCLLQLCLSLFIRPILSYIAVVCLMVASSYFCTPLLIGNCSMLARGAFATAEGIPLMVSLFTLIGVIVLSILIGGIRFHRYDILNKA